MPLVVSFDWLVSSCHKMFFFPRDSRVSKIKRCVENESRELLRAPLFQSYLKS